MHKTTLRFMTLVSLIISGCITRHESEDMATKWAAQMGYEDAKIVCQDGSEEGIERISWACSIATNHVQFPIPLMCSVNGCVISSQR